MLDHNYPEEIKRNGHDRQMRREGCRSCRFAHLEPPKATYHLCVHPDMTRRFDVTPFIKRDEAPKRCPLEDVR